jgi:hypothetical protein
MAKGDKLHNQSRSMEMVGLFCFHIQDLGCFLGRQSGNQQWVEKKVNINNLKATRDLAIISKEEFR